MNWRATRPWKKRPTPQKAKVGTPTRPITGTVPRHPASAAPPIRPGNPFSLRNITLFFLAAALAYWPALRNGFVYDDAIVIMRDTATVSPQGIVRIFTTPHYPFLPYYRPVPRLSIVAQKQLSGTESAAPFHAANILLAGACALLVYAILRSYFPVTEMVAVLSGLMYGLHPIVSSAVYPAASGRETILPVLLMLSSLYSYLRRTRDGYWISAVLYALALFGKEQAIVLPAILAASDLLGVATVKRLHLKTVLVRQIAFFAVTVLYWYMRWSIFGGAELSFNRDVLLKLAVPLYALQQAVLPSVGLRYEPMSVATWFSWPKTLVALTLVAALATVLWKSAKQHRNLLAFCLVFFLASLLPNANIVVQDAHFDERYTALALVPLVAVAAMAVSAAPKRRFLGISPAAILAAAALAFGIISLGRGKYFHDDIAFGKQWAATSPDYYLPHYNLGRAYQGIGDYGNAVAAYRRSIDLNPGFASSQLNLGTVYFLQENYSDALRYFTAYARLNPGSANAYYHLGLVHRRLKDYGLAAGEFMRAIQIDPSFLAALNNLGGVYESMGKLKDAREWYGKALELDPSHPVLQENLRRIDGMEQKAR